MKRPPVHIEKIHDGTCLDTVNQIAATACHDTRTDPTFSRVDFAKQAQKRYWQ